MKLTRLAAVTVAAAGLLLSACGGPNAASSAAIVGAESVSNTTLATYVADVRRQRDQPVDEADQATTTASLSRLVIQNLVSQSASRLGITVTDGEVQIATEKSIEGYGGLDALEAELLKANVPATAMPDAFRMSIEIQKMGKQLAPSGDSTAQQQAVYEYVFNLSAELKPDINPRFGTWKQEGLQVGDLPTDLSIPADSTPAITPSSATGQ